MFIVPKTSKQRTIKNSNFIKTGFIRNKIYKKIRASNYRLFNFTFLGSMSGRVIFVGHTALSLITKVIFLLSSVSSGLEF